MRVGWLTSSFGRLVSFYTGCLVLEALKKKETNTEVYTKLRDTKWIFPQKNRFPFLTQELNHLIKITETQQLTSYKLATKFKVISNRFSSHQDEFGNFAALGYGKKFYSEHFENIMYETLESIKNNLKFSSDKIGVVGFYARDNHWDSLLGHSTHYIGTNNYRNPETNQVKVFVESLLDLGYGVIRLGRSSYPLFGDSLQKKSMGNFFDYACKPELWSDQNDFALWKFVDFGVVTNGGAIHPALFFGKPLLIWDFAEPYEVILETVPKYRDGSIVVIPRCKKNQHFKSNLVQDKEFLNFIFSHLNGTKVIETARFSKLQNILVYSSNN